MAGSHKRLMVALLAAVWTTLVHSSVDVGAIPVGTYTQVTGDKPYRVISIPETCSSVSCGTYTHGGCSGTIKLSATTSSPLSFEFTVINGHGQNCDFSNYNPKFASLSLDTNIWGRSLNGKQYDTYEFACNNNCNGNGMCLSTGAAAAQCMCDFGYTGSLCGTKDLAGLSLSRVPRGVFMQDDGGRRLEFPVRGCSFNGCGSYQVTTNSNGGSVRIVNVTTSSSGVGARVVYRIQHAHGDYTYAGEYWELEANSNSNNLWTRTGHTTNQTHSTDTTHWNFGCGNTCGEHGLCSSVSSDTGHCTQCDLGHSGSTCSSTHTVAWDQVPLGTWQDKANSRVITIDSCNAQSCGKYMNTNSGNGGSLRLLSMSQSPPSISYRLVDVVGDYSYQNESFVLTWSAKDVWIRAEHHNTQTDSVANTSYTYKCSRSCSSNGQCLSTGVQSSSCACDSGWTGSTCDQCVASSTHSCAADLWVSNSDVQFSPLPTQNTNDVTVPVAVTVHYQQPGRQSHASAFKTNIKVTWLGSKHSAQTTVSSAIPAAGDTGVLPLTAQLSLPLPTSADHQKHNGVVVSVVVDSNSAVAEADESNNLASTSIDVWPTVTSVAGRFCCYFLSHIPVVNTYYATAIYFDASQHEVRWELNGASLPSVTTSSVPVSQLVIPSMGPRTSSTKPLEISAGGFGVRASTTGTWPDTAPQLQGGLKGMVRSGKWYYEVLVGYESGTSQVGWFVPTKYPDTSTWTNKNLNYGIGDEQWSYGFQPLANGEVVNGAKCATPTKAAMGGDRLGVGVDLSSSSPEVHYWVNGVLSASCSIQHASTVKSIGLTPGASVDEDSELLFMFAESDLRYLPQGYGVFAVASPELPASQGPTSLYASVQLALLPSGDNTVSAAIYPKSGGAALSNPLVHHITIVKYPAWLAKALIDFKLLKGTYTQQEVGKGVSYSFTLPLPLPTTKGYGFVPDSVPLLKGKWGLNLRVVASFNFNSLGTAVVSGTASSSGIIAGHGGSVSATVSGMFAMKQLALQLSLIRVDINGRFTVGLSSIVPGHSGTLGVSLTPAVDANVQFVPAASPDATNVDVWDVKATGLHFKSSLVKIQATVSATGTVGVTGVLGLTVTISLTPFVTFQFPKNPTYYKQFGAYFVIHTEASFLFFNWPKTFGPYSYTYPSNRRLRRLLSVGQHDDVSFVEGVVRPIAGRWKHSFVAPTSAGQATPYTRYGTRVQAPRANELMSVPHDGYVRPTYDSHHATTVSRLAFSHPLVLDVFPHASPSMATSPNGQRPTTLVLWTRVDASKPAPLGFTIAWSVQEPDLSSDLRQSTNDPGTVGVWSSPVDVSSGHPDMHPSVVALPVAPTSSMNESASSATAPAYMAVFSRCYYRNASSPTQAQRDFRIVYVTFSVNDTPVASDTAAAPGTWSSVTDLAGADDTSLHMLPSLSAPCGVGDQAVVVAAWVKDADANFSTTSDRSVMTAVYGVASAHWSAAAVLGTQTGLANAPLSVACSVDAAAGRLSVVVAALGESPGSVRHDLAIRYSSTLLPSSGAAVATAGQVLSWADTGAVQYAPTNSSLRSPSVVSRCTPSRPSLGFVVAWVEQQQVLYRTLPVPPTSPNASSWWRAHAEGSRHVSGTVGHTQPTGGVVMTRSLGTSGGSAGRTIFSWFQLPHQSDLTRTRLVYGVLRDDSSMVHTLNLNSALEDAQAAYGADRPSAATRGEEIPVAVSQLAVVAHSDVLKVVSVVRGVRIASSGSSVGNSTLLEASLMFQAVRLRPWLQVTRFDMVGLDLTGEHIHQANASGGTHVPETFNVTVHVGLLNAGAVVSAGDNASLAMGDKYGTVHRQLLSVNSGVLHVGDTFNHTSMVQLSTEERGGYIYYRNVMSYHGRVEVVGMRMLPSIVQWKAPQVAAGPQRGILTVSTTIVNYGWWADPAVAVVLETLMTANHTSSKQQQSPWKLVATTFVAVSTFSNVPISFQFADSKVQGSQLRIRLARNVPFFWLVRDVSHSSVLVDVHSAPDLSLAADDIQVDGQALTDGTWLSVMVRNRAIWRASPCSISVEAVVGANQSVPLGSQSSGTACEGLSATRIRFWLSPATIQQVYGHVGATFDLRVTANTPSDTFGANNMALRRITVRTAARLTVERVSVEATNDDFSRFQYSAHIRVGGNATLGATVASLTSGTHALGMFVVPDALAASQTAVVKINFTTPQFGFGSQMTLHLQSDTFNTNVDHAVQTNEVLPHKPSSSSSHVGAIIGGTVAGVVVLVLVALLVSPRGRQRLRMLVRTDEHSSTQQRPSTFTSHGDVVRSDHQQYEKLLENEMEL